MQVLYEFPADLPRKTYAMRGTCEILDAQYDQCAGHSIPIATAMQIQMINWGMKCNFPRVTIKDPDSACAITAQMGVRPFVWRE